MNEKTVWELYTEADLAEMEKTVRQYMDMMNRAKTERESARLTVEMAREAGYTSLTEAIEEGRTLKPGDKVYANYNDKTVILYHIGRRDPEAGMHILGAHIDSPRLDIKPNPLYETDGLAYLDTQYYGGVKNYQWVTIPLALHGVVAKKDGSVVQVVIGEDEDDPVFTITDILPHLGDKQMQRKAKDIIEGEDLDLLIAGRPLTGAAEPEGTEDAKDGKPKERVKAAVLQILQEKYGMCEEDFLSAELEVVPAGKARELGIDRSMVLAYGHDDRICAFTSLMAMLRLADTPETTSCLIVVDKEEIGSYGASGMQSRFFENMTAEMLTLAGHPSPLAVRRCLQHSKMLSSDVSAGYDPLYQDVFEKRNAAYLGKGLVFNKYTGSRGKGGSSDANPEYMAALRRVLDEKHIAFQLAEMGKVDAGGGGTIAWVTARYGMEVIDSGLALLCMHAPMEVASKADIHEAVRGYQAFLEADL